MARRSGGQRPAQGPAPATRRHPDFGAGAGAGPEGGHSEQLDEFCRGLHPILVAGDVEAFRNYLAAWEEMVGDTAELADSPPEQQRRTMDALLRFPQRFRLPPWPAPGARLGLVSPSNRSSATTALAGEPDTGGDVIDTYDPQRPPPPGSTATDAADAHATIVQLDMVTGEFVPVSLAPRRSPSPAERPGIDEGATPAPRPRSARRARRAPASTAERAQLGLWD